MTLELIESIANGDYVSANELFESRLEIIKEQKLFEEKRRIAALHEVMGGMTRAEAEKRIRERGMKPRKAADVLGDPRAPTTPQKNPKTSKAPSGAPGDIESQVKKLGQQWKSAKFGEKKAAVRMVRAAAKKYADTQTAAKPEPTSQTPSDARRERVRQSWDRFRTNLAAKMDRNSAMEKKRKEFLTKNPMVPVKAALRKGLQKGFQKGKSVVSGAMSDIASHLEE